MAHRCSDNRGPTVKIFELFSIREGFVVLIMYQISSFFCCFSYGFGGIEYSYNSVAGISGERIKIFVFQK